MKGTQAMSFLSSKSCVHSRLRGEAQVLTKAPGHVDPCHLVGSYTLCTSPSGFLQFLQHSGGTFPPLGLCTNHALCPELFPWCPQGSLPARVQMLPCPQSRPWRHRLKRTPTRSSRPFFPQAFTTSHTQSEARKPGVRSQMQPGSGFQTAYKLRRAFMVLQDS